MAKGHGASAQNGKASNDAIGNIIARRRENKPVRDAGDVVAQMQRTSELRQTTLGDLARVILNNELSTADAASLCEGIFFPMFAKLCRARGNDAVGKAALRLAFGSLSVLLAPGEYDEALVLKLDAITHGFAGGVETGAVTIVELATMVESSAGFRRMNDPVRHGIPFDKPTTTVAEQTPNNFRDWLVHRYGPDRIPTAEKVAGWLDKHNRGKLTTARIVTKILHGGGFLALGASAPSERAMFDRVRKVLDRHGE